MSNSIKIPVSVIVPTKNEAANIRACLDSVAWADEVFVVDSHSTDETVGLAELGGARVVPFDYDGGWPKKKNWALRTLPLRNEWVLILDADERVPAELRDEIAGAIKDPGCNGYYIHWKFIFLGRWMRHCWSHGWMLRLLRRGCGEYEDLGMRGEGGWDNEVHENIVVRGGTGRLRQLLIHESNHDLSSWIDKQNAFSDWNAARWLQQAREPFPPWSWLVSGDPLQKRRWLKALYLRLPGKPLLIFIYLYFVRLGLLDGRAGLLFCALRAAHEINTSAKIHELRSAPSQAPRSPGSVLPDGPRLPMSIVVLTLNEAANIAACLESVAWADDAIVVDSLSSDGTADDAKRARADARVFTHAFVDFGDQRNWALDNTNPKHEWIMFLDADERITPDCAQAIRRAVEAPGANVGFFMTCRNFFLGRWIRHCTLYPSWQLRLLKAGQVRFRKEGHGQREVTNGPLGYVREPYDHFGFSKGIGHWIERHNAYSTREAELIARLRKEPLRLGELFARDPVTRRRCLKHLAAHTGFRPVLRFLYIYLLRGGFLDGRPGFTFASLRVSHEINITAKLAESERKP